MLYSEKGEASGPLALWGCASSMGAPRESKDGGGRAPAPLVASGLGQRNSDAEVSVAEPGGAG